MTLIGLDVNASRVRAIQGEHRGSGPQVPLGLPLDGHDRALPLALSLEERQPRVGRAGVALCRRSPHLACLDFLPYLGDGRSWHAGRHHFDAAGALALCCEHLQRRIGHGEGVTAALPVYISAAQAALLADVAKRARWRMLGSLPLPLAVALAAHQHLPWSGLAVVVDVDGHALTFAAVAVSEETLRIAHVNVVEELSRGAWLGRLLDSAALRCIRLSRRDPRESADTEQALFDQLSAVVDDPVGNEAAEMVLQTPHWYQHLKLSAAELTGFCDPLVQRSLTEMQSFVDAIASLGPIGAVLLTPAAARLPGLTPAIDALMLPPDGNAPCRKVSTDFGEDLIEEPVLSARVHVLDDDAAARAAFDLAVRQQRGELPHGHLDAAPLPGNRTDVALWPTPKGNVG